MRQTVLILLGLYKRAQADKEKRMRCTAVKRRPVEGL